MKRDPHDFDTYIIDTCRLASSSQYLPGAITYRGRKRIETRQWKQTFPTQEGADAFVRQQFIALGTREARNEGELRPERR